jgi:hypothetical protein
VVQHLLGGVYLVAFLSAAHQFRALLGENGLMPIPRFLASRRFFEAPSVFHLHYSDRWFSTVAWGGAALSLAALLGCTDLLPLWAAMVGWGALWALYLSIVNVGQLWYAFGWESLLLEAGFLAIFLGPGSVEPPAPVLWLLCWLLFRVEFGAGLIKLRGDRAWRDLTALYYHHETQPLPGPLSAYFHQLPRVLHRVEVVANHGTQLVVPFALFAPQPVADVAAVIIVVTQGWLMFSGNFAWLNLVTITLAFAAMDNALLRWVIPVPLPSMQEVGPAFGAVVLGVTIAMVVLSYWPVRNMIGPRQVMNRSFNKWHLGNTYGAFGGITRTRYEVIVEGTQDPEGASGWREYGFKAKPGDPMRRPPQIAPYHLRLDWAMWFCAIAPGYGRGWWSRFLLALLLNDPHVLGLMRDNPFPHEPPVFVRARLFHYRFSTRAERRSTGAWWVRTPVSDYYPAVAEQDFR